jgi:hypothetical protein
MFVVNYRNEPLALRVYDPNKVGPDGKRGMQADGLAATWRTPCKAVPTVRSRR